jgi:predicted ester cyclase
MQRFRWFVLFALVVAFAFPYSIAAQDDKAEAHKQTIIRIVEEGFNQGNLDVIDELLAPDYVSYHYGREGDSESFKGYISAVRAAMPDYEAKADMFVAEGDWLAFRFWGSGTFENEFALFPDLTPTGEKVEDIVHIFVRFNEDGQLVEEWDLVHELRWLTQLGVIPPMGE